MQRGSLFTQIMCLLKRRERWQLVGLGAAMLLMAVVETVGVASIMPFMQLVADPGVIHTNQWLTAAYEGLGFESHESFLLWAGIALLAVIAFNNGFSAFTTWLMFRFSWGQSHRLSVRLLSRYLDRPYAFFLNRNTATLKRNILGEVQTAVNGVILSVLKIVARSLVVVMILGFLVLVDVRLAGIMATVLGGAYGLIYVLLRRKQHRLGRKRVDANGRRFAVAAEALTGIKDVKVLGRERELVRRFKGPSWEYSRTSASNQIVARLPRYALETIAFGGILLIVLYQIRLEGNLAGMIPVLGLYAFAGYRLMPALHELFSSLVQIRFKTPALEHIAEDLIGSASEPPRGSPHRHQGSITRIEAGALPVRFERELRFRDVDYTYPESTHAVLRDISLVVERLQTVGIVGTTGAGKTTLVDLLLGLHTPTSGQLLVDGSPLADGDFSYWRQLCGYVPQEIFLSDDSIRSNIAFGISGDAVDHEAVERAARIAQIQEFIATLPRGFDTVVGERGIRLSGGQRQRIGIARALYHDPELLVLDEATNSLDGATERAVMETLRALAGQMTLIVIGHRLSTVRDANAIHLLGAGRIIASGTYEELLARSPQFRSLAGVAADPTSLGDLGAGGF